MMPTISYSLLDELTTRTAPILTAVQDWKGRENELSLRRGVAYLELQRIYSTYKLALEAEGIENFNDWLDDQGYRVDSAGHRSMLEQVAQRYIVDYGMGAVEGYELEYIYPLLLTRGCRFLYWLMPYHETSLQAIEFIRQCNEDFPTVKEFKAWLETTNPDVTRKSVGAAFSFKADIPGFHLTRPDAKFDWNDVMRGFELPANAEKMHFMVTLKAWNGSED